jgi:hypothetical protein
MTGQWHEVKSEEQRREEGKTDAPRVAYETDEYITYNLGGVFYKQYKLPFVAGTLNEHPKK